MIYAWACSVVCYLSSASKQHVLDLQLDGATSNAVSCIAIPIGFVLLFSVKNGLQRYGHPTSIAFAFVKVSLSILQLLNHRRRTEHHISVLNWTQKDHHPDRIDCSIDVSYGTQSKGLTYYSKKLQCVYNTLLSSLFTLKNIRNSLHNWGITV